ncbi:type VI secretion system baseplate subunit TssF [Pseudoduganella ginsengisoli]|nr:type VI secretion system baseplate subunit TssF [Pseudoduganella ginsengisoli]
MTRGLMDLLRHYERERIEQERSCRDFAERFPAEAGALGMTGGSHAKHPHTQGLLDAISFTNARTADRLQRNQQQLARDLIATMLPHMDRPSPPATIARFDFEEALRLASGQAKRVPRGTALFAPQREGVRCEFRTVYDVDVVPVRVADACFTPATQQPLMGYATGEWLADIAITLESTSAVMSAAKFGLARLRLFIDADAALAATLRDTLFTRVVAAWLQAGDAKTWRRLATVPLAAAGFEPDDAMLPYEARLQPACRIVTEYFLYPEKFNFFDLDLTALTLPPDCRRLTLHLGVRLDKPALANVLAPLARTHLATGCTPIVNLFSTSACPIYQDYTKSEYALLPSVQHAQAYEIYSVDAVCVTTNDSAGTTSAQFHPYYSLKHGFQEGRCGRYWLTRRDALLAATNPGYEMAISLVDSAFNPLEADSSTVSVDLTCTNRDLPLQLACGAEGGDLSMASPVGSFPIRMLRKPSRSYRVSDADHWRLVSHLSVSLHSLLQEDLAVLTEMLTLYDLPQSAVTRRQIGGMRSIRHRPARIPWRDVHGSGHLFGTEVTLAVDEDAYAGSGLHVFVQVLDYVFGLTVHLNSFVHLIVVSHHTGKELMRCKPRNGMLALV